MANKEFKFGTVPKVNYRRSKFDLSFNKRFSMSVGSLYPMYIQEIYPGDTFKVNAKSVVRATSSFLKPVMDNLFLDTYYFFVPNRLCFDKWKQVMGENTQSAWAPNGYETVPTFGTLSQTVNINSKTVGDYLGLPVGNLPAGISVLPFRAFALIYNEWFRDQNNIDPVFVHTGETLETAPNNNNWSPTNYTGKLPKVAKFHDYFTTCLPDTQKGAESTIVSVGGTAPVGAYIDGEFSRYVPMFVSSYNVQSGLNNDLSAVYSGDANSTIKNIGYFPISGTVTSGEPFALNTELTAPSEFGGQYINMVADLSGSSGSLNINDLRRAVAIQKMLEKDARSGTRYKEILESHFGVISPDASLQRPEYLGGSRTPINIQQVPQTSAGTVDSPLAQLGAYSFSNTSSRYTKSFTEHGFVIGVCCLRQFHTYQQGVEKFWSRSKRYDFYDPLFAHLGEQAVYKSELYAVSGESGKSLKDGVFGYNEAWADLRYRPSQTAGEMRSDATNTLDIWHFGDDYSSAPVLGEEFINETPQYVDRTLSVPSTSQDQFIVDTYFKQIAYRVLPTYSVPGYVDHDFT